MQRCSDHNNCDSAIYEHAFLLLPDIVYLLRTCVFLISAMCGKFYSVVCEREDVEQ